MATKFNYTPLRNTAIALVKQFGKTTQCALLRNVNLTPDDADKPWRGADLQIKEFVFTAVVLTKPSSDDGPRGDQKIIIPGDIVSVAATGDPATLCGMPTKNDRIRAELVTGTTLEYYILGMQDITPDGLPMIIKANLRAWPLPGESQL